MHSILLAALLPMASVDGNVSRVIDIPANTVVCTSRAGARNWARAEAEADETTLVWLRNGACARLPKTWKNQEVLEADERYPKVRLSNGRESFNRYLVQR